MSRPSPPRRQVGARPEDMAAAEVLHAAGGECFRCGARSPAMVVVERDGQPQAVCLNRLRCNGRARALTAAEDEADR